MSHQFQFCLPPRSPEEIIRDRDARQRAKLAFVAYCAAVADGDPEWIEATRKRYQEAAQVLAARRGAR